MRNVQTVCLTLAKMRLNQILTNKKRLYSLNVTNIGQKPCALMHNYGSGTSMISKPMKRKLEVKETRSFFDAEKGSTDN